MTIVVELFTAIVGTYSRSVPKAFKLQTQNLYVRCPFIFIFDISRFPTLYFTLGATLQQKCKNYLLSTVTYKKVANKKSYSEGKVRL